MRHFKMGRKTLWAGLVGASLLSASFAEQVGDEQGQPNQPTWNGALDLSKPVVREAKVNTLRGREEERREVAIRRARQVGLPIRTVTPRGGLRELMAWDEGGPLYYETQNANAAISTGSDQLRGAPYHADGAGWTLGVWDGGSVRTTHREFGGRATAMDGAAAIDHATHVGGTMVGAGITASAIGMATAADLDSYDWNFDESEMTSRGASYGGEPGKIYISNHSYGFVSGWSYAGGPIVTWEWYGDGSDETGRETAFGQYNTYTRDLDALAHSLPYYLSFWSAGNERIDNPANGSTVALWPGGPPVTYSAAQHPPGDGVYAGGYDTINFHSLAKNVMTIGAVNDAVTGSSRDITKAAMTSFSSWGPADDGRIKPDVVANGYVLYSASSAGDDQYVNKSGTSMSAPSAAGTAQQILHYYTSTFPGRYLRASTLKGLLIHTADDLGTAGPDYRFGWGLINAKAAADLITGAATNGAALRMAEARLKLGDGVHTYRFPWNETAPIRATLCWTDPEGSATTAANSRTPVLVNDLDMRIVGPTGTVHLPWVMPFVGTWTEASMSAPATTGTNRTDNVEQILIASPPAAGIYELTVTYSGTLDNNLQDYSLLVSGSAPSAPAPRSVSPESAESGSVRLTIKGTSFALGASVAMERAGYGSVSASVERVVSDQIDCTLDVTSLFKGPWSIRVTNPDGQTGILSNAFTVVETLLAENFDGLVAGWSAYLTAGSGGSVWALSTLRSDTAPYSYRNGVVPAKAVDNLQSASLAIPAETSHLRVEFQHDYHLEVYDGGVLEVSPDDGANWFEAGTVGSGVSFETGGYTGTVQARKGNPNDVAEFAGRSAWNGADASGFSSVVLALDDAIYAGSDLRLRWRLSTDAGNAYGDWYWHVDSLKVTGFSSSNAAPSVVTPAAASPVTVTNDTTVLSVTAADDGGEAALTYAWAADGTAPVTFSTNGSNAAKTTTAIFMASGEYQVDVTVSDVYGLSATSGVNVTVQPTVGAVTVEPAAAEVVAGGLQLFSASADDQFGAPLSPQPVFAWTVTGGGTINSNGLFTAGTSVGGPYTVVATASGVEGAAAVTITRPARSGNPTLIFWK